MTSAEVCFLANRSERTLWNWERAGLLHPVRVGRSKFYDPDEVEALLGITRAFEDDVNPGI